MQSNWVKYLWLLFDLAVGPDNLVDNGPYKYIFSTEGHLLPATPEISLVQEHCSYFGACCNTSIRQEASDVATNSQYNLYGRVGTGFPSNSRFSDSTPISGSIKGVCPGLTHGQKFGITYVSPSHRVHEDDSRNQGDLTTAENHSMMVVPKQNSDYSLSETKNYHENLVKSSEGEQATDAPQK